MRTVTKIIQVYQFSELSDKAKKYALDKAREHNDFDFYADCVIEDVKTIGALIGLDIDNVYYSGFSSQGDGACFTGEYHFKKDAIKAMADYAPMDIRLQEIAIHLSALQQGHNNSLRAKIIHTGSYYHENSVTIDVYRDGEDFESKELRELLKDLMRWTYRELEKNYDYANSADCLVESIESNEVEFTSDGKVFHE